ncbi:VPLPA-CTERM sorting domain-containing protein [Tropicibacter sp. S64]|uniref:VPLPA-CTERM sorting domain-containing protein n=1 Tax=Tropicibacter sp. S64 TaxID=3415122 RepID=UPI003C7E0D68
MIIRTFAARAALGCAALLASPAIAATITAFDASGNPLAGIVGSVDITESLFGTVGTYNVTNNITGAGRADLHGFGVSNVNTTPWVGTVGDTFGCANAVGNPDYSNICYDAVVVDASNWATAFPEVFSGLTLSFQDVFGDFASVVGTDNVFNYYYHSDGSLGAGGSIDNFFGFEGFAVASSIIGAFEYGGGNFGYFTAGVAGPGGPEVPLPAAGWMLLAGLGGLAAMRRRRKG